MFSVIFDMDGVIFDSERPICDLWIELADAKGIDHMEEVVIRCIGANDNATREIFQKAYGEDFPYDAYRKIVSDRFHERYDNGRLPVKPGIAELLSFLRKKEIKTALASSTRTENVIRQLKAAGLYSYFDRIIGGDMVSHSKPHPEIFLKAAAELGAEPKDCYVIEDSFNGIRAAHRAGMHPFMVPDILGPDEEIKSLAEKVFPSLTEVLKEFSDSL